MNELLEELSALGFLVEPFGNNSFVLQGSPSGIQEGEEKIILEKMLEQYKHFSSDVKLTLREKIWRSLASQQAVRPGTSLTLPEMQELLSKLFAAGMPAHAPSGRPVFLSFTYKELAGMFGR